MKTKQEKIIVPSIEFYDMVIRNLTSSITKRKRYINSYGWRVSTCSARLKSWDNSCKELEILEDEKEEQRQMFISGMLKAKKAIKTLAEIQRIEKKMLAHYIQLKRELTDGVKACNNFVEECNA